MFGYRISYISPQGMNFFSTHTTENLTAKEMLEFTAKCFLLFSLNIINLKMKKAFICQFTAKVCINLG